MGRSLRQYHALGLLLLAAAIASCSTTPPKPTGTITVTIVPADGITPSVVMSGPNNYHKSLTVTQTVNNVPEGSYTFVADTLTIADSIVGTVTDSAHVTGSPAAVTGGSNTIVTAVYSTKNRAGGMWVANVNYGTLPVLGSNQLTTSGTIVPADTLATPISGPAGLALDAAGNMWESDYLGDTLLMYSVAARDSGGGAGPTTMITSSALENAHGIGFDAHGNLWVANCAYGSGDTAALLEFSVAQLAAGGNITPAATINTSAYAICPYSMAFDASGNVWVSDDNAPHILEYSAAQLAAGSGSSAPQDTVGVSGAGILWTDAVVVDASGNVWTGGRSVLAEYTPAQLAAGGSPPANAIINMPSGSYMNGLAFDNRGTLWAADARLGYMYGLVAAQLVSGTPTPSVSILYSLAGGVYPQQPLFDKYVIAAPAAARLRTRPILPADRTSRSNVRGLHPMNE